MVVEQGLGRAETCIPGDGMTSVVNPCFGMWGRTLGDNLGGDLRARLVFCLRDGLVLCSKKLAKNNLMPVRQPTEVVNTDTSPFPTNK